MMGEIDEIMGFRHRELSVEGVQFHPESILTENGHDMLENFLKSESYRLNDGYPTGSSQVSR